jgi:hypothetical protein
MKARNLPLARYQDRGGRAHLVVLRGRLVLDLGSAGPPRLLAKLAPDEGVRQARALLSGEGGYLERAAKARAPLCRELRIEDVRPAAQPHEPVTGGEAQAGIAA